jgi:hypothetical protein
MKYINSLVCIIIIANMFANAMDLQPSASSYQDNTEQQVILMMAVPLNEQEIEILPYIQASHNFLKKNSRQNSCIKTPASIIAWSDIQRCIKKIKTLERFPDGLYSARLVQPIINEVLAYASDEQVGAFMHVVSYYTSALLINACAAVMMMRIRLDFKDQLITEENCIEKIAARFFIHPDDEVTVYLKKHYELKSTVLDNNNHLFNNNNQEYSIADLPYHNSLGLGRRHIITEGKTISSLYGLDQLSRVENIVALDLSSQCILDSSLDRQCPIHPFQRFIQVTNLNLSDNRIKRLTACFFKGLSQLKELELERNNITEIEGNPFLECPALSILWIDETPLKNLIQQLIDTHDSNKPLIEDTKQKMQIYWQ